MPNDLILAAIAARGNAVATYSRFEVGAAIETSGGRIFTGCNIESATYGLTVCAERVALWKALSEGAREFKSIVVVSQGAPAATPCGACRQTLWEHCGNIDVTLHSLQGGSRTIPLADLLPEPFDKRYLSTGKLD